MYVVCGEAVKAKPCESTLTQILNPDSRVVAGNLSLCCTKIEKLPYFLRFYSLLLIFFLLRGDRADGQRMTMRG